MNIFTVHSADSSLLRLRKVFSLYILSNLHSNIIIRKYRLVLADDLYSFIGLSCCAEAQYCGGSLKKPAAANNVCGILYNAGKCK